MRKSLPMRVVLLLVSVLLLAAASGSAFAQGEGAKAEGAKTGTDDLLSSVVRIKTYINPDGRTVDNLGQERDGSGIVIDDDGLILTIGYLMVEAHAAEAITNDGRKIPATVVGYDHDTGFGLLKAVAPLKVRPILFGNSKDLKVGDPVLAASFGGRDGIAPARVVSRREFAGSWEYLVDGAIYTAPAHSHWSGAALITRDGKLVGVGVPVVHVAAGSVLVEAVPDVEVLLEVVDEREVEEWPPRRRQFHGGRETSLDHGDVRGCQVPVEPLDVPVDLEAFVNGQAGRIDAGAGNSDHPQLWNQALRRRERGDHLLQKVLTDAGPAHRDHAHLLVR